MITVHTQPWLRFFTMIVRAMAQYALVRPMQCTYSNIILSSRLLAISCHQALQAWTRYWHWSRISKLLVKVNPHAGAPQGRLGPRSGFVEESLTWRSLPAASPPVPWWTGGRQCSDGAHHVDCSGVVHCRSHCGSGSPLWSII